MKSILIPLTKSGVGTLSVFFSLVEISDYK